MSDDTTASPPDPTAAVPAPVPVSAPVPAPAASSASVSAPAPAEPPWRTLAIAALVCAALSLLLAAAALWTARANQARILGLEPELVRRHQQSDALANEARSIARQAQDSALDAAAKAALAEARVAEVAVQRTQLDDLIQSLSRTRDENVLIDVESALRVAMQQASIQGSVAPLVATLKQSDERLGRYSEPRVDGVRRAISRDLERLAGIAVADLSALNIRLDEALRLVDELPLVAQPPAPLQPVAAARPAAVASAAAGGPAASSPAARKAGPPVAGARPGAPAASAVNPAATAASAIAPEPSASAAADGSGAIPGWSRVEAFVGLWGARAWAEVRSLLRVSRIDHPEGMLLSPEQAFFVRENLKLRLLNARVALVSRQYDSAQVDLQAARDALDRYFDRQARKVVTVSELLRQVSQQARQTSLPRPDDTLAALVAAGVGR